MRRTMRIALWVAVFAACAGVGAFIASRTDPFPPGVTDPGARSATPRTSPTGTGTPAPVGVTWRGHMLADTSHHLFVGGTCSTAWRITLVFLVSDTGSVGGAGTARLEGRLRCDFATAQVQSRTLQLAVTGRHANGAIALSFAVKGRVPAGSDDYGGLIRTLPSFPSFPVHAGAIKGPAHLQVSDGGQGTYGADYRMSISCRDC